MGNTAAPRSPSRRAQHTHTQPHARALCLLCPRPGAAPGKAAAGGCHPKAAAPKPAGAGN
jgi:hypothetical protein